MAINKGTIAIIFASAALIISCYNTFFKEHTCLSKTLGKQKIQALDSLHNASQAPQNYSDLIDKLNKKVDSLQHQVANLKLQSPNSVQQHSVDEFKQLVFDVLAEKEQQELDKLRDENPLFSFYADLPDDYDLKIKSDPDYAKQTARRLKEQALNPNIADLDRLAALSQLQMNMLILNKPTMSEYDYETVGSLLDLAQNGSDDKFKIQTIELATQTPVLDYRLTEQFTHMLERDTNDYVRRLAAQGLITQYYQAQSNKGDDFSKQVAQHILALYNNTSDNTVKETLEDMIGNQEILDELRSNAGY